MTTCKNCRHWLPALPIAHAASAPCRMMQYGVRVMRAENDLALPIVTGTTKDNDLMPSALTGRDFGCVHGEGETLSERGQA